MHFTVNSCKQFFTLSLNQHFINTRFNRFSTLFQQLNDYSYKQPHGAEMAGVMAVRTAVYVE